MRGWSKGLVTLVTTTCHFRRMRLSGAGVKAIACATMLCDHTAIAFHQVLPQGAYLVMRTVGRVAFPLFCMMLVEGALHTRDWRRYALRLLLAGIVSEVPFDLLTTGSVVSPSGQNVMWTLLLGLLGLRTVMWARDRGALSRWQHVAFGVCVMALACMVAEALRCDYVSVGILAIGVLYAFRTRPLLAIVACYGSLALMSGEFPGVLLALPPMVAYDGRRGRQAHPLLFYAFYPGHLLVLWAVAHVSGLI